MKENKNQPYQRIACHIYDEYEIHAMRQEQLSIEYLDDNDDHIKILAKIKTLQVKDKAEYLITEDELWIRLDKIINKQIL